MVKFYFDYISPWAYFGWMHLQEFSQRNQLEVEMLPVSYPNLSAHYNQRAVATLPPKREFIMKASVRYAARHQIPFQLPCYHPYKPYSSLRISLVESDKETKHRLVDQIFKAVWVDKVDMSSDEALFAYLNDKDFDIAHYKEQIKATEIKQQLTQQTLTAAESGVFGVPTFQLGKELFWGCDQFADMQCFLDGNDPASKIGIVAESIPSSWGLLPPS